MSGGGAAGVSADVWPCGGPARGAFSSSDARLNEVWDAAVATLAVTTIPSDQGAPGADTRAGGGPWMLVDGAKRDRLIWAGDLAVQVPAWLLAFGDPGPAYDSLAYLADHQRDDGALPGSSPVDFGARTAFLLGEYTLWGIVALDAYGRRTGDRRAH